MGGKGSGGRRPGSGAKGLTDVEREITGNAGKRGRLLPHPGAAPPPSTAPPAAVVEELEPPKGLDRHEKKVWRELAPFAVANGTLVRATSLSFRLLCRNIVLEKAMAGGLDRGGPNHRGIIQRIDAELLRFNLSPCGKPMYRSAEAPKAAPVANPLNRFLKR